MDLQITSQHRERVEEFRQKHRTALVTLLFTDLVGSTKMKQELGDSRGVALIQSYHAMVRGFLDHFPGGEEISTAGDSFFTVFVKPSDAVRFSLLLQSGLRGLSKDSPFPLLNRIGIHLGEVVVQESDAASGPKDMFGMQVDTCARIMSLADGDQTLMSRSVFDNARQVLKGEELEGVGDLTWMNHGTYVVKGVEYPLEVCEVGEDGLAVLTPPGDSAKARRHVSADDEPVLGWRPALEQVVPGTEWVLEEKLGEGGFGEVWKARHRKLKECRVFKFCFRADRVRSLKREVTLFRVLKERVGEHSNIVRLHDVYFDEPPYYIVTEYVEGKDLVSWCDEHGGVENVPLETRLEIVAQAAEALQAAHDAGIIHRDVKPSNVLIGGRGTSPGDVQVKLTDFGIGQVTSKEALAGVTQAGFTQTMLVGETASRSGTHLYMAPEVIGGKPATTRSDVYSLGVVFYQLLIGDLTRPIAAGWEKEVDDSLLQEDVSRCYAGDPDERFVGALELARNLKTLETRRATLAEREAAVRKATRRRMALAIAASISSILFLLAIALGYGLRQAVEARNIAERQQYYANIGFANASIGNSRFDRARELLLACPVRHRNWEWGRCLLLCNRDLFTLEGHSGRVESVAFSPDGQRIVTGSLDHTAKVWDVETGREVFSLEGHFDEVRQVAFSPDGQRIVTGGGDLTMKVWDAETGRELLNLQGHPEALLSVAFSPDGKRIVTGSLDNTATAKVWDTETGRELLTLRGHSNLVWSVAFSPDSQRIVTGSEDSTAKVWDAETGREVFSLEKHSEALFSVAFSSDGKHIVTGSQDNTARIWDAETGREIFSFEGHSESVVSVAFSLDGKRIVAGSEDSTAKVWDAKTGREVVSLEGHSDDVGSVAFSPDGQRIVTGSLDNTAKMWDAETGREVVSLEGHSDGVREVAFSPDGRRIVTGSKDHTAKMWDAEMGREVLSLEGHSGWVNSVAFSPDDQRIVTASHDNTAKVWDAETGREVVNLEGHSDRVMSVAFSPDGQRIVTGSHDHTAKVWDAETGRELFSFTGHSDSIRQVAFNPDGKRILTGSWDNTAKVWDAETGREVVSLEGHSALMMSVAFSPDSKQIATGGVDKTARIWDAETGHELISLEGHSGHVYSVAFSPDGQRIVTGGGDLTMKVWDAETGRELLNLQGHSEALFSVSFSPDGKRIVTGSNDSTAKVWDAFPWREEEYPGDASMPFEERVELYKREYWRKRLAKE